MKSSHLILALCAATLSTGRAEVRIESLLSPRLCLAPLLVIQGGHDPRVVERESRDVVEQLRAAGKSAEFVLFDNEGHDILKFENRVRCYNTITDFFKKHLKP